MTAAMRSERVPHKWWLAGIVLTGALARLWGISVESIWLDEATSLMLARMSVPDLVYWTSLDIHPPLYYTLLHYWIALGGSELVIRGLSALAGLLNILVVYDLSRTWFGRRVGLMAATLLALLPVHVWYGQETRMYAWVTLLICVSVWLAFKAWSTNRWLVWLAYVLVTAASLYTHYYAVFGIFLQNLFFLYMMIRRRVERPLFLRWLGAEILVLLFFLPWLPTFLLPITVGGGGWIAMGVGRPTVAALAQTAVLYMVGTGRAALPELVRRLAYGLYLLILGIAIWPWKLPWQVDAQSGAQGTSDGLWTRREAAWFCAAYMSVPPAIAWTVSQIFKPMYSARYMLPFSVPFVILVAFGLDRLSKAWLRRAVLALLAVVMIWGLWAQVQIMEKPDWRGLAQRLSQEAQPGDLVLFMPGWHAKPFDYYSKGDLDLYYDVPIPVDRFGQEAIDNVAQAIEGHPRVWFVWEEDHYTDSAGQVHQYLDNECAEIDSWPMQWVGRVILYENVP